MFHLHDAGCYADATFGHAHVRATLARLLEQAFRHHPRGGEGTQWPEASELVTALRAEMSDDASEEDEAIDMLNEHSCSWEVRFEFVDGDLMLVLTEDAEAAEAADHG